MADRLRAYYRLTKPGIIYGNLVTAAAGFFLACQGGIYWALLAETLAGMSLVMASACVFNNYIDRGIDSKMARTKLRATVTGQISGRAALSYASLLGMIGFIILAVFTNWLVFILGAVAIFSYVILYGLAKRHSLHSTLVGSLPGALPPSAGYLAVTDHIDAAAVLLFLSLVFWQMPHFYAISMYRLKDYRAAGLPLLAVKKGQRAARHQIMAYIVAFTLAASLIGFLGFGGIIYETVAIGLGIYWFYLGFRYWRLADEAWGKRLFLASLAINLIWSVAVAVGGRLP